MVIYCVLCSIHTYNYGISLYIYIYRSGLHDVCVDYCLNVLHEYGNDRDDRGFVPSDVTVNNTDFQWSFNHSNSSSSSNSSSGSSSNRDKDMATLFSECMVLHCPYTEPTLHNPEVSYCYSYC